MAATSATINTPGNAAGQRQSAETCVQAAVRRTRQGTNAGRGPWWSEGDAGRHLRTTAGQGHGTPSPLPVPLRRERLATQARAYPEMACTPLAPHVDVVMLADAFRRLNPPSAPGGDRGTWRRDKEHLATNLETVHEKLGNDTYGPQPVGRRLIPKSNGTLRPLGRPALEDTIVAKAGAMRLEALYEQDFYDVSHGLRPGRRPHQARHEVGQGLRGSRRGQVIDCDSRAFFDPLPHATLLAMRRKRSKASRVLTRIERWRHAGRLDGTEMGCPDKGRPQGAVCSPLLANVYVPEVLDTWLETVVRAHCRGKGALGRVADDFVIGCELEADARRSTEGLPQRFAKYGREITTAKPQVVDFGRPPRSSTGRNPGTVNVLGFGHDWGKTWRGGHPIKRKTEGKRLRRALGAYWRWGRDNRPRPLQEQYAGLCAKLRGDSPYYGIRCNSPCRDGVYYAARRAWRYWLHRRGGRKRTWRAFGRMMAAYALPRPKIGKAWG